jgi:hypothetical protein
MEYQVPQFIEVEDKIFGPFTLKQFIYIAGGIGLSVVIFLYTPIWLAVILILPIAALTGALAFYRVNNKPFIELLEAGLNYYTKGKLYLWKKDKNPEAPKAAPAAPIAETRQKLGLTQGKLHELAWSLDIKDQNQPPQ